MDPVPHRPVRPLGHLHSDLRLFSDVAGPRNRDPGAGHCRAARLLIGVLSSPEFWRWSPSLLGGRPVRHDLVFSRGGTDILSPEEVKTRFTDVWGQDHVLNSIKENIAFLERPDEIEEKGGYIPGGMLLWGPPGTGKTLIAESIAGETGRPYVFVDPGVLINMFMGVGIIKVKSLYRKLRKLSLRHGGVIVFFDEADSLGSRGAMGAPRLSAPPRDR